MSAKGGEDGGGAGDEEARINPPGCWSAARGRNGRWTRQAWRPDHGDAARGRAAGCAKVSLNRPGRVWPVMLAGWYVRHRGCLVDA